jgi:hypothetical protein
MSKAKLMLAGILIMAAAGGAVATKARAFIGIIVNGGVYYTVLVPFDCPNTGPGCIYTSWDGGTFQVYTLSGLKLVGLKP